MGMIKRFFPVIYKELFLVLYNVYVRSHLVYCVQVWAPYYQKDIKALEKVQQRDTKLVKAITKWSYKYRLAYLELYSLERRLRFKILNGFECIDPEKFFSRAKPLNLEDTVTNCSRTD